MSKFEALFRNLGCSWCWLETRTPHETLEPPATIFIMGPSSSGKSTVGRKLALSIGYTYVNLSDLLEKEIETKNQTAEIIIQHLTNGQDAPPEITTRLLIDHIRKINNIKGFIVAGFPNSVDELRKFELSYAKPKVFVYCSIPEEVYVERNLKRHQGVDKAFLKQKYAEEHENFQNLYRIHENKTLKIKTDSAINSNNKSLIADLETYWGFTFNR